MPALPRIESFRCGPLREVARRRRAVSALLDAASSPQTKDSGNAILAISDRNQSPLGSPCAAEIHGSSRHRGRQRRRLRRSTPSARRRTRSARRSRRIGRPQKRLGHVRLPSSRIDAARSSVRLLQRRVLRAEAGVAADLRVGRLRVPEEVPGRVDADHHRAVDAPRVPPGVDHREARAGALADEVDLAVAERLAGGLEVVDLRRAASSRARSTPSSWSRAAQSRNACGVGVEGLLAEAGRSERFSAEETSGQSSRTEPSTPAVADEHDVVARRRGGSPS